MGTIGENVKALRVGSGWTQEDLARISGVAENYISAIERGARTPGKKIVGKLCDAFAVDEMTIRFGARQEPQKETPQAPEHLKGLFDEIARIFPDSYSLIDKSEKIAKVMRDLRGD